jgi:hypothetical protein
MDVNALLSEKILDTNLRVSGEDMALCGRATYVHFGRQAAMIVAPSTLSLFDARLRLVIALISCGQ